MTWLLAILAVLVIGAIVVVATGRGAPMAEVYDDRRDVVIPDDRPIRGADLDQVRFTTAVRGYRMDEVDALLARLRSELNERDASSAPDLSATPPAQDGPTEAGPKHAG